MRIIHIFLVSLQHIGQNSLITISILDGLGSKTNKFHLI